MEQINEQVVHGALDYGELERLSLDPSDIHDFSVNTNPYGPSPLVRQAIAQARIDRYPDREYLQLRRTILAHEPGMGNLPLDSILCGNGAAELIWAIARAFLQPSRKAAIVGPTFGEYRAASRATGATIVEYPARAADWFHLDLAEVSTWIQAERPAVLWFCNPNNPTGIWLNRQGILRFAEACARTGALLVIDEAYWRFLVPQEEFSAVQLLGQSGGARLLVLRSLTKDYALAGVRLGYAVAAGDIIARLSAYLPSWNVSALAQAAGIAAMMDRVHLIQSLDELARERHAFFSALHNFGTRTVPSRTHFCLIEVGDAHAIRQRLLSRHILVRDCTSFGLPEYLRVATQQRSEWQHFMHILQEVL